MRITNTQISEIALKNNIEYAILKAFVEVESGGIGFDTKTGKILIQFEPHYFKRKEPFAPSGAWSINKVDVQTKEWLAFNNAYSINPDSAMESTSIGMPQILGEHWKRLGFKSVGDMWDYFKKGEREQIEMLVKFVRTDNKLFEYLTAKNWHMVAYIYNGSKYKEMAKKWGREPYNISLEKAYKKYS